ncbi:hypothetical protein EN836_14110 [Mesorhizobium sp. M1C.F.Ca.ET.193.01.1.1]|uniref:hypothetical protein n=1 Tax=unclassified Mesorhizobium TaxID=325217 RepID=UPI000FD319ED|nr:MULTISPECIES: hypothetical protein [unclassified Mesorhizobium]TGT00345.1 hypothetical protein EN820_32840 [bacterium M00.F.Ca.ET.177.01.1.1]TGQ53751.1 hypothetical protein EN853_14110 [Mesorhizobium sp. M1C.F.Ca.ET.210.01.1.1]TGQ71784.1 hypothetical protein EN855_014120 [Mesorhizobium sp. M1C.F.Ca.ET.212.01.1.1]TGR08525.1 hypothetical protein EN847_14110 [Mesorhizobium sp. M1C.F.Ca.ET.204.01.1.1]TGR28765.1 hypothetical protein EN839_14115 [Mesorhizobium sp. M1C.F.Ca.ET.196.01.1.1]
MKLKLFAIVLGTVSSLAGAAQADTVRVRGTVVDLAGTALTVKAHDGKTDTVTLTPGWMISGAKASATDIKQGDFLGIASVSKVDGGSGALEVVIFPAALRGTGEGDRDWDLQPNSRMTNGTVADVTGINGQTVTLTYSNGLKKEIAIPQSTPIVTFATATPADLKPGMAVFVSAERGSDGKLVSRRVVVGNHGVAPPM